MKKLQGTDKDFRNYVHDMWSDLDDEMDRLELKVYIGKNNMPNIKMMNESDDIGVEEVIVIGTYANLTKLHNEMHRGEEEGLEEKVADMFAGKRTLREIAPSGIPDEVLDALEKVVDAGKKAKKRNRGEK